MTQRSRLIDRISSIPENRIHPVYDEIYPILKQNLTDDDKAITIVCCPHKSFSMNTNTFFFITAYQKICGSNFLTMNCPVWRFDMKHIFLA